MGAAVASRSGSPAEVFRAALRLGLTSFGGPIAHLGYFRREYVERRGWVDEATYADLVALAQSLPGPSSSQVGIGVGIHRAGLPGGLASWFGFTLPSAVLMLAFAGLVGAGLVPETGRLVAGLQVAAVAVVAQAVVSMARRLAPDPPRAVFAGVAAALVLSTGSPLSQVAVLIVAALAGRLLLAPAGVGDTGTERPVVGRRAGLVAAVVFLMLLATLPLATLLVDQHGIALADAFYRTGALVFGGGHVVLPLLDASVVGPGWVSRDAFLAGYGAAQAVPGPLFSFSAYLGAIETPSPNGIAGALVALPAIFLPGGLLVVAGLSVWGRLTARPGLRSGLAGIEAAVVGVLLAALWDPVITTGIRRPADAVLAGAGFVLLLTGRVPPIAVVGLATLVTLLLPA